VQDHVNNKGKWEGGKEKGKEKTTRFSLAVVEVLKDI